MFTPSERSFQTLESVQRDAFITSVAESLVQEMPEFANDLRFEDLKQLVHKELIRAEQWGIEDEEAIGLMSGIALAYGAEVFDDPEFANYIRLHEGDAAERLKSVLDAFDDEA